MGVFVRGDGYEMSGRGSLVDVAVDVDGDATLRAQRESSSKLDPDETYKNTGIESLRGREIHGRVECKSRIVRVVKTRLHGIPGPELSKGPGLGFPPVVSGHDMRKTNAQKT
jgi:hypothetical protein